MRGVVALGVVVLVGVPVKAYAGRVVWVSVREGGGCGAVGVGGSVAGLCCEFVVLVW